MGHHHFAADQHRAPCCTAPFPGRPRSRHPVGRRPSSGQPPSPPRQRLSTHAASPAATTFTVASREVASRQPASARWRRASRTCEVGVGVGLADLIVHVLLSLCPYSSQANSLTGVHFLTSQACFSMFLYEVACCYFVQFAYFWNIVPICFWDCAIQAHPLRSRSRRAGTTQH